MQDKKERETKYKGFERKGNKLMKEELEEVLRLKIWF